MSECVSCFIGEREMRKVVNEPIDSSSKRFAVIESRWTDRRPDRFILEYRDEESLRELIATTSIIALGLTSREGAMKRIEACLSAATPWRQIQKVLPTDGTRCDQHGPCSSARRLTSEFFSASRWIVRRVLRHAVAAAVIVFYSGNTVSTLIRAFIGA